MAFEHEPGKLPALYGSCTGDLLCAEVDTQNLSSWPDLFSEMQSRDTVPAGDVKDGEAWSERKVLEQGFSKGGGPIVVGGKRPARPRISRVFTHADSPVVAPTSQPPPPSQEPPAILEAGDTRMAASTGKLRMILRGSAERRRSARFGKAKKKPTHLT